MESWFTAFPVMRSRATNRVASEDQVVAEVEFTGTHTGPMAMGDQQIPATGRTITGTGIYFAIVRDRKIVSFSAHPSVAAMMGQLGFLPGTYPAGKVIRTGDIDAERSPLRPDTMTG